MIIIVLFIKYIYLMNSGIDQPETHEDFPKVKCISPNLASDDFLELMQLDFSDFEWKKVASIWWWFGILEMDLANLWIDVEIIDPIHSNEELRGGKRQETYDWICTSYTKALKHKDGILEGWIAELKKDIEVILDYERRINLQDLHDKQQELEEKEELKKRKDKLLHNKLLLKQNLEKRNNNEKPNKLTLNPSSGENIEGIEPNSKDFVFINHILNYFPDKIDIFLGQANKILKDWWTIFIVDYADWLLELQKFFREIWTYNVLWWTFCGSIKKWEIVNLK